VNLGYRVKVGTDPLTHISSKNPQQELTETPGIRTGTHSGGLQPANRGAGWSGGAPSICFHPKCLNDLVKEGEQSDDPHWLDKVANEAGNRLEAMRMTEQIEYLFAEFEQALQRLRMNAIRHGCGHRFFQRRARSSTSQRLHRSCSARVASRSS